MHNISEKKEDWYMKERLIPELVEEIRKTHIILGKIESFYQNFRQNDFVLLGKKKTSGIVMAEIFTDFYTCLETF